MSRHSFHRALFITAVAAASMLLPRPASSHLPELTKVGNNVIPSRWNFAGFPVQWNLNPATGSNITGSNSAASAIQAVFDTWTSAPNANIPVTRGADSAVSSEASSPANINLICFVCMDADFSKDSGTLAVTITTTVSRGHSDGHGGVAAFDGQIIKSDIIFNPNVKFTTDGTGSGSTQDLQTVATHEVGHFLGMDHTGVTRAIMFPFAPASEHTLSYDDDAGISTLYPKAIPDMAVGSIAGTVRMQGNNAAVFGAHVYAGSTSGALPFPTSFNLRKSPISTLCKPDGTYLIQGVPADSYIITAEPLDGPESTGDVQAFSSAFGATIQTNFTTRWH
ncbi:MAG TPA: matrixin family metalloprotease [Terriglobales bacterium]|nr:matrixin family metalloprotease [Terriglobales bacterium]